MLTFLTYFVLVINGNRINRFHLFWDTLYLNRYTCIYILTSANTSFNKKLNMRAYITNMHKQCLKKEKKCHLMQTGHIQHYPKACIA